MKLINSDINVTGCSFTEGYASKAGGAIHMNYCRKIRFCGHFKELC